MTAPLTPPGGEADFTLTTPVNGSYTIDVNGTDETNSTEETAEPQRTFTPEDVNRIVQERLAKQKAQYGVSPAELKKLRDENAQLKQATQTETERAIAEAEKRGYEKARIETAKYVAIARIEAALTGIVDNPKEVIEDLNLARYVSEDGAIDEEAVTTLRNRYLNLVGKKQGGSPRVGHGRTSPPAAGTPQEQFVAAMSQLFNQ